MARPSPDPGTPGVRLIAMRTDDIDAWYGPVVAVYRAAFAPPPYNRTDAQVASFAAGLFRHVGHDGWHAALAVDDESSAVGFAYGYSTAPGQWWHDQVWSALGDSANRWLVDAFEFVELAVHPSHRRRGIGQRLHDELLAAQTHSRAVLTTLDAPTAGLALYRAADWHVIADGFRFERTTIDYLIMGREPAWPGRGVATVGP